MSYSKYKKHDTLDKFKIKRVLRYAVSYFSNGTSSKVALIKYSYSVRHVLTGLKLSTLRATIKLKETFKHYVSVSVAHFTCSTTRAVSLTEKKIQLMKMKLVDAEKILVFRTKITLQEKIYLST